MLTLNPSQNFLVNIRFICYSRCSSDVALSFIVREQSWWRSNKCKFIDDFYALDVCEMNKSGSINAFTFFLKSSNRRWLKRWHVSDIYYLPSLSTQNPFWERGIKSNFSTLLIGFLCPRRKGIKDIFMMRQVENWLMTDWMFCLLSSRNGLRIIYSEASKLTTRVSARCEKNGKKKRVFKLSRITSDTKQ